MARKRKTNQSKLLKKFSRGGFSAKEKKTLRKKLSIDKQSVNRLTKAYSKQLKLGQPKPKPKSSKLGLPKSFKRQTSTPMVLTKKGAKAYKKNKGKSKFTKFTGAPGKPGMGVRALQPAKKPFPNIKQPPVVDTKGLLKNILGRETPEKQQYQVNPELQNLFDLQKQENLKLNEAMAGLRDDNYGYKRNIVDLQGKIGTYENQIATYQSDLEKKISDLNKTANQANQFKLTSTEYLNPNSAGGIRLRRSKRFMSGDFAKGTSQLNRHNRKLKMSSVNL